ncbi:MAG: hypothetical protein EU530_01150 [Promethearchaeota archaeon]|nr:MAG: hypothetical protein EU530_01150 [Candidatus Lokiarchaeota archaeon]
MKRKISEDETTDVSLENSVNYIKKEQMYLLWSGIFPAYSIGVNVVNISFVLIAILNNWILIRRLVDILIPLAFFFLITIFSTFQFIFLTKWKNQFNRFQHLPSKPSTKRVSLTDLFYSIIEFMEKARIFFILVNIAGLMYFIWGFDFFITGIPLSISLQMFAKITFYLNLVSFFILLLYLIYQWFHFVRWNKKLRQIKEFEKKINEELDL